MTKIIPHNRLTFDEAECEAVVSAVRSGQWAQGTRVAELEAELARIAGVAHAVCVASGLGALRLALGALGLKPADRVLVPSYACVAVANAVLAWGAIPIPTEVEEGTWNLDPRAAASASIKHQARVAIAVNTFGLPSRVEAIKNCGIAVIEDCAHAFGSSVNGRALGSRARIGVLSFYATKLIGGGEGGAVLTNSPDFAQYVRATRDYTDQPPSAYRLNDKMNDLEAALVLVQLHRLPAMLRARQAVAERYLQAFSKSGIQEVFRLPEAHSERVWYRFALEMLSIPASKVVTDLARFGVQAAVPVTNWRPDDSPSCPVADRAYDRLVSLPAYPTLTPEEQEVVVDSCLELFREYARG